jgi:hypothetical protein
MAIADAFVGLPIESLILDPLLAAAKGQAALAQTTLDFVDSLAFEDAKDGDTARQAKIIDVNLDRLANSPDGQLKNINQRVQMPLLPLVTIPNFSLDTMEIDFMMEVKTSESSSSKESKEDTSTSSTKAGLEVSASGGFGFWSASAKASVEKASTTSGTVSSSKDTQRSSDQSAKYHINVKAKQNEPAEGMAKFNQILATLIEPIDVAVKDVAA